MPFVSRATSEEKTHEMVGGFEHIAFFYSSEAEYVDVIGEFVEEGLALGEPTLIAVPTDKIEFLGGILSDHSLEIGIIDVNLLGRNPARLNTVFERFYEENKSFRTRIVCEQSWPGRLATESLEVARHEAISNIALEGRMCTMLCPYDYANLKATVVFDAARTHPAIVHGGITQPSPDFTDPYALCNSDAFSLDPPPDGCRLFEIGYSPLISYRMKIRAGASAAGLDSGKTADLVLAFNEAATNTMVHGNGWGEVRTWSDSGQFVCEVADKGLIDNLLVGLRLPDPYADNGRGLWLANQLCDLVQIRSGSRGTTVRLRMSGANKD